MNQAGHHPHQHDRDQRRTRRKPVAFAATVMDVITGEPMGQIGNLSGTGMLLICPAAPQSEAIHQVRLPLSGDGAVPQYIEAGIQEQWHESPGAADLVWAGYRIIAISEEDDARLDAWLALPG
ncbi:PilZ domain-containing protein [Rhodanobacter denitrificans]|uniref:PilZ domain-containing protein n=1 Tax=Rhodanobacter denitrificans TaxID=666685 RepID=UPI0016715FAE|nr:PilZ domain-containing protein [Rhodanobacter denitrificans]